MAPQPKIPESEFSFNLGIHLADVIGDPEETSSEFLGFCEPIIFGDFDLSEGIARLPAPFDSFMYVYQAWGLIGSDGFECYLDETDHSFDEEVDKGLKLFGCRRPQGVLKKTRFFLRLFGSRTGMLPKFIERFYWKRFYSPLEEFERDFLGPNIRKSLSLPNKAE